MIKKEIDSTEEALKFESANIKYAKNELMIGANTNVKAALPGAAYSERETGTVYAVPVLRKYKNQESFFADHVTHYQKLKSEKN